MDYYQFPLLDMRMTGQRIRETCSLQGLTVRDVRISLGIGSFQSVYNWFAGKTLPSLDHMVSLSYLLKKSLDELVCSTGVRIWEAPEPDETRQYGQRPGREGFFQLTGQRDTDFRLKNEKSADIIIGGFIFYSKGE